MRNVIDHITKRRIANAQTPLIRHVVHFFYKEFYNESTNIEAMEFGHNINTHTHIETVKCTAHH